MIAKSIIEGLTEGRVVKGGGKMNGRAAGGLVSRNVVLPGFKSFI